VQSTKVAVGGSSTCRKGRGKAGKAVCNSTPVEGSTARHRATVSFRNVPSNKSYAEYMPGRAARRRIAVQGITGLKARRQWHKRSARNARQPASAAKQRKEPRMPAKKSWLAIPPAKSASETAAHRTGRAAAEAGGQFCRMREAGAVARVSRSIQFSTRPTRRLGSSKSSCSRSPAQTCGDSNTAFGQDRR